MWPVVYDKWLEKWVVCEYTRSEDAEGFFWREAAEQAVAFKNAKFFSLPGIYDTEEANDVWPGGLVNTR